jgi:hypothetical protein
MDKPTGEERRAEPEVPIGLPIGRLLPAACATSVICFVLVSLLALF